MISFGSMGILFKLNKYLPYNIFKILESYLKDRTFYVKFKDKTSALHAVKSGVPQGSVLGPILYLLYTADIPIPSNQYSMIATFADDTVLIKTLALLHPFCKISLITLLIGLIIGTYK